MARVWAPGFRASGSGFRVVELVGTEGPGGSGPFGMYSAHILTTWRAPRFNVWGFKGFPERCGGHLLPFRTWEKKHRTLDLNIFVENTAPSPPPVPSRTEHGVRRY